MILDDRAQLQELMARYANALDAKDYPAIRDCFVEDATINYVGFTQPVSGAGAITAYIRSAIEPLDVSQHIFGNFIIAVTGASARLSCDIIAQHVRRGEGDGETLFAGGKYQVQAAAKDGAWLIASIFARSLWSEGNRHLLPKSA